MKIPVLDLNRQNALIKREMGLALAKTLKRSDFILGEEEKLFEAEFAAFCGRRFAVGVNSGTDALFLSLLGLGIGAGDEVIVPVFTYIASAFAVTYTGARPVFVDIDEKTYNIDVEKIEKAITGKTKAIMPVHLYGQPADMKPVLALARKYKLKIVEDAAQAHGAKYRLSNNCWRMAGSMGDLGCFSFYPTKNLGALGDGGMIAVDDKKIYEGLLMLRDYGRKSRYEHVRLGYNSRLDTVQAAILRIKLRHLRKWNQLRRESAAVYKKELKGVKGIIIPFESDYSHHVFHVYAARLKNRKKVMERFKAEGIGALIHYPIPLHLQKVYKGLGYKKGDFPVAERVAQEIVSLPMYPYLKKSQIKFIAKVIKGAG